MQKVIAFSIDINKLVGQSAETFNISEPEELNGILAEGWEIEDWSFLTDNPVNGKMPMFVVLNDDVASMNNASEFWDDEDEDFMASMEEYDEDGDEEDEAEEDDEEDPKAE